MITNYVSSDTIIAKLMSDLDIQEESLRITDIREWIFEAIEKIGAVRLYALKESNTGCTPVLNIHNYLASTPSDMHRINQIAYSTHTNGPWLPMRVSTGSFKNFPDKGTPKQLIEKGQQDDNVMYPLKVPMAGNRNTTNFDNDHLYFLKPGYIVTNRREGFIKLSYSAIILDDRGYPMVPDMASYNEALYWYVVWKLKYPDYLSGKLNESRFYYIQNRWNFYRNQAYAEAMMPTEGDMVSIKNNWLKLFPEINAEDTFYSEVGAKQHIYNNYYGRVY